jgi:hypothetical protein
VHTVKEGIIAHGAVMLDVDDHSWRSMIHGLKDPIQQELEAIERLVATTDQSLWLIGPDLKDPVTVSLLLLDLHDETKVAEDGSE